MIKTGKVTDRRTLRYGRMEDILRDVEWLNGRVEDGVNLRASGNYSPAQIVDHVARVIVLSIEGFSPGVKAPLPERFMLKWTRQSALTRPMKAGVKSRGRLAALFAPDAGITWGQAHTRLRNAVARLQKAERMTAISPSMGAMAHEEWIQWHCRHAELHLSFVHAG